jgi:microsomal dipeptidase-like Zn-dependent dipeptidase
MLASHQQWCTRCDRYVETEQKQSKVGRQGKLVSIIVTCRKCRTTLSSKTTSTAALQQMQAEAAAQEDAEAAVKEDDEAAAEDKDEKAVAGQ